MSTIHNQNEMNTMNAILSEFKKQPLLLVLPIVVVAAVLIYLGMWIFTDHTQYVTGTIEAKHADVAAKIPARIKQFAVEEGQAVDSGSVLVRFENREIGAKVEQARAAMGAAEAKYRMAMNGARKEEVSMAEKAYQQAHWNVEVLKKTYDRMKPLHEEGVISQQQWDEVDYKYRAAQDLSDAARDRYLMTKTGAREEEKMAARSLFQQAKNAVEEAQSYYDETSLRSPIKGIVEKKIVNNGELVAAGYALITIVDPTDWWVIVNIDEKHIGSMQVGQTLTCVVPARNDAKVQMKIARMSVLSDFATRKATNELNSFDTRSFEVKLVPVDATTPILQGMTVLVPTAR